VGTELDSVVGVTRNENGQLEYVPEESGDEADEARVKATCLRWEEMRLAMVEYERERCDALRKSSAPNSARADIKDKPNPQPITLNP